MTENEITKRARELQREWLNEGFFVDLKMADLIVRAREKGGYVRINADGSIEIKELPK